MRSFAALWLLLFGVFTPAANAASLIPLASILDSPGAVATDASYELTFSSNSEVDSQIATLDFREHRVRGQIPARQDQNALWIVRGEYDLLDVFSDGKLNELPREFPATLNQVRLQLDGVFFEPKEKSSLGVSAGFGVASDEGLGGESGYFADAGAFYRTSLTPGAGWVFAAHFSNNRNYLNGLPIPGVMYFNYQKKTIKFNLGFPVNQIVLKPAPNFDLSLVSFIGRSTEISGQIAFTEGEYAIFGAEWNQYGYIRGARVESKDRFFWDDKRAYIGLKALIASRVAFVAKGGLVFSRQIFQAKHIFASRDSAVSVQPAVFGAASLGMTF